jgi:3-hydroxyacyl-[acyl-carrier-protein] dehydratase
MKFQLIDTIETIQPGERIVTRKNLSLAEEYLGDHFPTFPVLPGVLMLEAATQSAAWLVRLATDYAHSVIVLKTARNVRYNYFLKPGNTLICEVVAHQFEMPNPAFKVTGRVGERQAMTAKIELACQSLADRGEWGRCADDQIITQLKRTWNLIGGPAALASAGEQVAAP